MALKIVTRIKDPAYNSMLKVVMQTTSDVAPINKTSSLNMKCEHIVNEKG